MIYKKAFFNKVLIAMVINSLFFSLTWSQTARQIAQNSFPSVVLLIMQDEHGQTVSLGSGFFVSGDIMATNLHVTTGAARGYAKIVNKMYKYDIAGWVSSNSKSDLILLKINGAKAPSLKLCENPNVNIGDEVYVIGNPQGLEGTLSQGIISSVRQLGSDTLFQITAPISPGSSGGPVLNKKGEVIGVAWATIKEGQNLNFAIPVSYLSLLMRDTSAVKHLSAMTTSYKDKSEWSSIGGTNAEGVTGTYRNRTVIRKEKDLHYIWFFTIRNKLNQSVKDIHYMIIWYDDCEPIDFEEGYYKGIIPTKLAKTIESSPIRVQLGRDAMVEIKILDFRLAQ